MGARLQCPVKHALHCAHALCIDVKLVSGALTLTTTRSQLSQPAVYGSVGSQGTSTSEVS
eukprot:5481639-Lingulodinium_polyedra.AAC.1